MGASMTADRDVLAKAIRKAWVATALVQGDEPITAEELATYILATGVLIPAPAVGALGECWTEGHNQGVLDAMHKLAPHLAPDERLTESVLLMPADADNPYHESAFGEWLDTHDSIVVEDALREFVQWVATQRAFNGSDHSPHAQALYNECLNAVLPEWAEQWLAEREEQSLAERERN